MLELELESVGVHRSIAGPPAVEMVGVLVCLLGVVVHGERRAAQTCTLVLAFDPHTVCLGVPKSSYGDVRRRQHGTKAGTKAARKPFKPA